LVKEYKTIQGDTWDSIAYKTLGSEYLLPLLLKENQKYRKTFVFASNITIKIPEIKEENTVEMPPWLRD
jgi:hypothetical protein